MSESRLVFVYGSLRSGEHNNPHFMPGSKLLGSALTDKMFRLSGAGTVPFASFDPVTGAQLEGELWECPVEDYHSVRNLELGAGYEEHEVDVWLDTEPGSPVVMVKAFMYTHPGFPGMALVEPDYDYVLSWPRRNSR